MNVTVVEKNKDVGGRARLLEKKGYNFDMGPNKNDLMTPYSFSSQQGTARMQATNDFNDTKTNNRYYAPSQPNQNYGNNNNNSNNIDLNQSYLNNDINNNNNLMMNNTTRYREDANKVQYLKPVITQGLNRPMGNKNTHNHYQHHQQLVMKYIL